MRHRASGSCDVNATVRTPSSPPGRRSGFRTVSEENADGPPQARHEGDLVGLSATSIKYANRNARSSDHARPARDRDAMGRSSCGSLAVALSGHVVDAAVFPCHPEGHYAVLTEQ